MKKAVLVSIGMVLGTAGIGQAQSACLPRDALVERLSNTYSEELSGRGLKGESSLFEIFRAKDGATWTIVQTFPNGMSCVMASGEHWIDSDVTPVSGIPG